jgi:catechol 2,3-dioxygenase
MTNLPFAATTPVSVARVGLRAADGEQLATFYKHLLGLTETRREGSVIALGAHGRELLEIDEVPGIALQNPREAGLFHTAFLLPRRGDLARWIEHARVNRIRITGASDHLVSEALYLNDPEGNGIEIYADRDRADWPMENGVLKMATDPLDFDGLMASVADDPAIWNGAPDGTVVGHVHLRVGDAATARAWWTDEMKFDRMVDYGDAATFLATGGYHHHIGANMWQSRGAGLRDNSRAGLAFVELEAEAGARPTAIDPWGTEVRTVARAA